MDDSVSNQIAISSQKEMIARNKSNGFEDLNDQERAFCFLYIVDYDHRKAADEVGAGAHNGLKMTRRPLVSAFVAHLQEQNIIQSVVTKDYLDVQHQRLYEMALGEVEVAMVDKDGGEYMAKKFQGELAFKLLQDMGKLNGVIVEEEISSKSITVEINMNNMVSKDIELVQGVTYDV